MQYGYLSLVKLVYLFRVCLFIMSETSHFPAIVSDNITVKISVNKVIFQKQLTLSKLKYSCDAIVNHHY